MIMVKDDENFFQVSMGIPAPNQSMVGIAQPALGLRQAVPVPVQSPAMLPTAVAMESKVLDKRRLQELVKEVDPLEQLDEDVEEVGLARNGHEL